MVPELSTWTGRAASLPGSRLTVDSSRLAETLMARTVRSHRHYEQRPDRNAFGQMRVLSEPSCCALFRTVRTAGKPSAAQNGSDWKRDRLHIGRRTGA
ncbi:hypothetical protein GCM10012287_13480 [Streptomyces daqingensis]|uniref:Uncharacterized protein n=1 Tax=Streptomyces daqingensis TaxID=1472640 RepID=A0ABQ2M3E3_9ACTN|nr:hypothetical protein GCM10012287_13480 [Streptomyces daqingensis]